MANTLIVKNSATPGKVPLTSNLSLGEIAINSYDGKMYILQNSGTATVIQIGGPSATAITQIQQNLGNTPSSSGSFSITGSGFTVGKPVSISQDAGPYTNKGTLYDEIEFDQLAASAYILNSTTINVNWASSPGPVAGYFQFNYFTGA
jgi:hypothetical protein